VWPSRAVTNTASPLLQRFHSVINPAPRGVEVFKGNNFGTDHRQFALGERLRAMLLLQLLSP
jgi:hypothetical protein